MAEKAEVSLTSLTFGDNSREIEIGWGAFNKIDVDELVMYTSYKAMPITEEMIELIGTEDYTTLNELNYIEGYIGLSDIDKLIIKPTEENTIVSDAQSILDDYVSFNGMYSAISCKSLIISEGITEIGEEAIFFILGLNIVDGELSLPSTLTKISNHTFAYIPYENVNIPSNVIEIGQRAFVGNLSLKTITLQVREDTLGMTLGESWNGGVTVVYEP